MGNPILHNAITDMDINAVERALDAGQSADQMNEDGETALYIAAGKGSAEIVRFLLEKGANPNLKGKIGVLPIHAASSGGHVDIVRLLVEHGALYDSLGRGLHPLLGAASNGNLSVVKYFVEEKGVPLNDRSKFGQSPLRGAAANGHVEVVQYLLGKGADPSITDDFGHSVFTFVEGCMGLSGITKEEKQELQTILQLLRDAGSQAQ